jgi:hypothetical protein
MYLPYEIRNAQILISVKTYPQPSTTYDELVCTAGFLPDGTWIRLYPVPLRGLPSWQQYQKYHWITLDLIRNTKDFRPESYRPLKGAEYLQLGERLGTTGNWEERKKYALKEVFTSMGELIQRAKSPEKKSLATLKPREILDFVVEKTDREWKPQWIENSNQLSYFDLDEQGEGHKRNIIRKLPFKYFYRFRAEGDREPRKLMIADWEIGALFWREFDKTHDEDYANKQVTKKFFYEFLEKNDLSFFLGTTHEYHNVSPDPFIIIGVFYPLKEDSLAKKTKRAVPIKIEGVSQPPLFDFS